MGAVSLPDSVDDVIVGAGITGLATATMLARAGRSVLVLEARHLGQTASGLNTGKVSVLQGRKLSRMLSVQSERVVAAYLEGNRRALEWLVGFCEESGVQVERRSAYTFAATAEQTADVRREYDAARRLGLPVQWRESLDVPFGVHGAVELCDQAQVDPRTLLGALARDAVDSGAIIAERSRVTGCSWIGAPRVTLESGAQIRSETVVLATGIPILDRGLYFAKVEPRRSYLLAFEGAGAPPGMMLSSGSPVLSLRDATVGSRDLLLVGGSGHVVGRTRSEAGHLEVLRAWTASHYPGSSEVSAWSAQDYSSHDGIPFVGRMPRGAGHVYVATGFDKWGLTNGPASAKRIAGAILGKPPTWADPLGRRITRPRAALGLALTNAKVGLAAAATLAATEVRTVDEDPAEGQGSVGRSGASPVPVGTCRTAEGVQSVVAVCTHLGGTLCWNDAEGSWDCPLHGSRFAADGAVLEGPATRPLTRHTIHGGSKPAIAEQ